MAHQKIRELPGHVKDTESQAILNTNRKALKAYKKRKIAIKNQEQINQKVLLLENDISEIKNLLIALVEEKQD